MNLNKLLEKWKARRSAFRAKAEEAFFASSIHNNPTKEYLQIQEQHHWETCVRQYDAVIEELEQVLNES